MEKTLSLKSEVKTKKSRLKIQGLIKSFYLNQKAKSHHYTKHKFVN